MIPKLALSGLPFEKTHLLVGDYVLKNLDTGAEICVERKILPDFISSIYDKRIFKELEQMENSFSHSFIILVGKWDDIYKQHAKLRKMKIIKQSYFSVSQRLGIFAHILCRYNHVKLLQVENDNQFLEILPKLLEKCTDGKGLEHQHVIKVKSKDNIYKNLLMGFPNISSSKADKIILAYPTWQIFTQAILSKTFKLEGIGKTGTETFYNFILGLQSKAL